MITNGTCVNCNKLFTRYDCRETEKSFCSMKCYNEWRSTHIKTLKCKQCGNTFARCKGRDRLFCSKDCFHKWRRDHTKQKLGICKVCGKRFYYYHSSHEGFYCSRKCLYAGMKKGITKKCEVCGKPFYWLASTKRKYCSQECYWTAKTGIRRQTRTVVKICLSCKSEFKTAFSNARAKFCSKKCKQEYFKNKLQRVICETCRKQIFYRRTKRKSPRFCSIQCRRFGLSGGLTVYSDSKSAKRFLKRIYGGDKCLICGWDKTPNEVCHIIPARAGGQTKVENLVLLCPNHHKMYDNGLIPPEVIIATAMRTFETLKGTK